MNIDQIQDNLKNLEKNIDKENFIFDFLLSYDQPRATINRLKKGDYNKSKDKNQLIWKKKIFYHITNISEDVHDVIDNLSKDEITKKNSIRFIIVTDFKNLLSIDTKTNQTLDIEIKELSKNFDFFLPLIGSEKRTDISENFADIKAAEKMGKLFDCLIRDNADLTKSNKERHGLNIFFTRILFCFFAEDSEIFKKGIFTNSISYHTQEDGSDLDQYLKKLFQALNDDSRNNYPIYFNDFPFVNGSLFKNDYKIPKFNKESRKILIESGNLDWSSINPDILGSMMQAIVNNIDRDELGMHYTSVKNILKVIKPLFLDDLYEDIYKSNNDVKKLRLILKKIYNLRIFDPACGSGNFLVISFKEICKVEIEIYKRLKELDSNNWLILKSAILLTQFCGIEKDDYAHEAAKLSLWIAEHQMNIFFNEVFGETKPTLPLSLSAKIICDNAVQIDWNKFCPKTKDEIIFVIGNPPYKGARRQTVDQKKDMTNLFSVINNYKSNLDYVGCWFFKAVNYINKNNAQVAFVSVNSICQGEQVEILWPDIFKNNIEIGFAYLPFKWTNSAKGNAGVFCVIINLRAKSNKDKFIYNEDERKHVKNINPYLVEGKNIIINSSNKPISDLSPIVFGSTPNDGGNLILSDIEKIDLINSFPLAEEFILPLLGAEEFLKKKSRWCIWLLNQDIKKYKNIPLINDRIDKVKKYRLQSKRIATNKSAKNPHLFAEIRHTNSNYILIPSSTSSRRKYLPVGFQKKNIISTNLNLIIPNPKIYEFGIISSKMHMLWLKNVGGRLGDGLRYSAKQVYNTFPFPKINKEQEKLLEETSLAIVDTIEKYPEKTYYELFDPENMPELLLNQYKNLDDQIDLCYRKKSFNSNDERIEILFKLYEEINNNKKLI